MTATPIQSRVVTGRSKTRLGQRRQQDEAAGDDATARALIGASASAATWKTHGGGRDDDPERPPAVGEQRDGRADGMAPLDGRRVDGAALLEEEAEQGDDRAAEREQQAEGDGGRHGRRG